MRSYVKARERDASPQLGHDREVGRRAANAANARVPVKRTVLSNDDQKQTPRHGSEQHNAQQNSRHQSQHIPRIGQYDRQIHDAYDTDAQSIDTTLPQGSVVQVRDSQSIHHQDHQEHDEEADLDDDEEEDEDNDERQEHEFLHLRGTTQHGEQEYPDEIYAMVEQTKGLQASLGSYPTTTSGYPGSDDDGDDQRGASPSPQRGLVDLEAQHHSIAQSTVHIPQRAHHTSAEMLRTSSFKRGLVASTARSNRQPVPYSISDVAVNAPSVSMATQGQTLGASVEAPIPQRGTRPQPGASWVSEQNPQRHSKHAKSVNGRLSETPAKVFPTLQVQEQGVMVHPLNYDPDRRPIEDYENEVLFAMDYSQLKNEGLEHNPRPIPSVLSEDMVHKPLAERLEYVKRSLDENDQAKFFSSLPTEEWENAGDWFIEQFSSIIKGTKEARQNKRKLAQDFEAEVEKRYKHVEKKQESVNDALKKMQDQGQSLIPKGPGRASKSPGKA